MNSRKQKSHANDGRTKENPTAVFLFYANRFEAHQRPKRLAFFIFQKGSKPMVKIIFTSSSHTPSRTRRTLSASGKTMWAISPCVLVWKKPTRSERAFVVLQRNERYAACEDDGPAPVHHEPPRTTHFKRDIQQKRKTQTENLIPSVSKYALFLRRTTNS